jgi:hypothetical protein
MVLRERLLVCWNWLRSLGPQHHIFLSIQFLIVLICVVFWAHLPPPGWSVAILAFAAAAMSVHGDIRGWQKAVWMALLGILLIVELRSISRERAESQKQFDDARKQLNIDFAATAFGLQTAINGIQTTLRTADQTLQQTRAHSAIRFDRFEFAKVPERIEPNSKYFFNFYYVNAGTETASDVTILARSYVGVADDRAAQNELVHRFEEDWTRLKGSSHVDAVLIPASPSFGSIERSFDAQDIKALNASSTIYLLARFEYSDETGRWRTDACSAFQRQASVDTNITHSCAVFQEFRYPVPKAD